MTLRAIAAVETERLPLVLDLDGTLLRTDALMETMAAFVRRRPAAIFQILSWLLKGRPYLKQQLAAHADCDVALWPLNEDLAAYAAKQAKDGRVVVLATASDIKIAQRMKDRFPFISDVIASEGVTNLKSGAKAAALVERFPAGFVYAGDARPDIAVWRKASGAIIASNSISLTNAAAELAPIEAVLAPPRLTARDWVKALRVHQWAKNALIFAPLFLGGRILAADAWFSCCLAFVGMGLLASSSYLLNDLVDLEDDRRHWSKRRRGLASGQVPISYALAVIAAGIPLGCFIGYWGGGIPGLAFMALYLAITLAYSFMLKRLPLLDAFTLAALFTIRLAMGVAFAGVSPSAWLLVFSMFLFTSLSLAKRMTEIQRMAEHGHEKALGRGYLVKDTVVVAAFGASSSIAAILVFVLYLINEAFQKAFYDLPAALWVMPCLLAIWLGRIWLLCGRGELADDPVAFAMKDKASLVLGGAMGLAFVIAAAAARFGL